MSTENIESFRLEVAPNEPDTLYQMEGAEIIKNAIKNAKNIGGILVNSIPHWDLRIVFLSHGGHSYNKLWLQYNIKSKKTRIIVQGYEYQAPNRDRFIKMREMYNKNIKILVSTILEDDKFWNLVDERFRIDGIIDEYMKIINKKIDVFQSENGMSVLKGGRKSSKGKHKSKTKSRSKSKLKSRPKSKSNK